MEQLTEQYEKLMEKYIKLKMEHEKLKHETYDINKYPIQNMSSDSNIPYEPQTSENLKKKTV